MQKSLGPELETGPMGQLKINYIQSNILVPLGK
jgi:hypothetical protein